MGSKAVRVEIRYARQAGYLDLKGPFQNPLLKKSPPVETKVAYFVLVCALLVCLFQFSVPLNPQLYCFSVLFYTCFLLPCIFVFLHSAISCIPPSVVSCIPLLLCPVFLLPLYPVSPLRYILYPPFRYVLYPPSAISCIPPSAISCIPPIPIPILLPCLIQPRLFEYFLLH